MAKSFATLPATAQAIEPFTVSVPEEEVDAFRTLLRLSKVATPTYESSQEDRRYGVTSAWMVNAKNYWLNEFDWYVHPSETRVYADRLKRICFGIKYSLHQIKPCTTSFPGYSR